MALDTDKTPPTALPSLPASLLRTFLDHGAALWNSFEQIATANLAPAAHEPPSVSAPRPHEDVAPVKPQGQISMRFDNAPLGTRISAHASGTAFQLDAGCGQPRSSAPRAPTQRQPALGTDAAQVAASHETPRGLSPLASPGVKENFGEVPQSVLEQIRAEITKKTLYDHGKFAHEWGGWIIKNGDKYSYTIVESPTDDHVQVGNPPPGAVAQFHSHPPQQDARLNDPENLYLNTASPQRAVSPGDIQRWVSSVKGKGNVEGAYLIGPKQVNYYDFKDLTGDRHDIWNYTTIMPTGTWAHLNDKPTSDPKDTLVAPKPDAAPPPPPQQPPYNMGGVGAPIHHQGPDGGVRQVDKDSLKALSTPAASKPDAAPPPPPYHVGSVGAPIHYEGPDGGGGRPVVSQAPAPGPKAETAEDLGERRMAISSVRANIYAELRHIDEDSKTGTRRGDPGRVTVLNEALKQLDKIEKEGQYPIVGSPPDQAVRELFKYDEDKPLAPEVIIGATKQVAADGTPSYTVGLPKDQKSATDSSWGEFAQKVDATFHRHARDPFFANDFPGPADPVEVLSTGAPVIYAHGRTGGSIGYNGKKFTLTPVAGLDLPSYKKAPDWMRASFEPW